MPISYHFSNKTIWVTLIGQYSLDEMRQVAAKILHDPAFTDDVNLLLDARQSTVNPPLAEIKDRVTFLKSVVQHRPGRIAIVVSDTLRYGLTRMLTIYAQMEGLKITAFMNLEQAREWLEAG